MITVVIAIDVPDAGTLSDAMQWIEERADLDEISFTAVGIPGSPPSPYASWVKPPHTPAENVAIHIQRIYGVSRVRPNTPRPAQKHDDDPNLLIHPNVMPDGNDKYVYGGEIAGVKCRLHVTDAHAQHAKQIESLKYILRALHAAGLITDPPID